jgi:hypothetical protein
MAELTGRGVGATEGDSSLRVSRSDGTRGIGMRFKVECAKVMRTWTSIRYYYDYY